MLLRFIVILSLLLLSMKPALVMAAAHYVSVGGSDSYGLGTQSKPWRTLAKADSRASRGDTVYVAAGTYVEDHAVYGCLVLTKGVTWVGSGAVKVRPARGATALRLLGSADGIKISNMAFNQNLTSAPGNYVVYAEDCNGSRIFTNCTFTTSGDYLIRLQTCGRVEFHGCHFTGGTGTMIYVTNANLILTDCAYTGKNSAGMIAITSSSRRDIMLTGGSISGSFNGDIISSCGSGDLTVADTKTALTSGSPLTLFSAVGAGRTGSVTLSNNRITASVPFKKGLVRVVERTSPVDICGNDILLTHVTPTSNIIELRGQSGPRIVDNHLETSTTGPVTHISVGSDGAAVGAALIRGNVCRTRSLSGYAIVVGTDASSIGDNKIDGAVIEYNRILGPAYYGVNGKTTLHGILLGHNRYGHVRHNYVNGAGYGVILKGTGQDWGYIGGASYNILSNCTVTGGYAKGVRNTNWYNNTCWLTPSADSVTLMGVGPNVVGNNCYESTGTRIKYNIFCGPGGTPAVAVMSGGSISGLECDSNCLWSGSGNLSFYVTGSGRSLSQWQSLGMDTRSMNADPLFVNPALYDFRLQATSPCINPDSTQNVDDDIERAYLPQYSYGALQPIPASM